MNWQFTEHGILREMGSGYEIHLDGGSWDHPKRLKPVANNRLEFPESIALLRSGLRYIKAAGYNRNVDIERSITRSLLAS